MFEPIQTQERPCASTHGNQRYSVHLDCKALDPTTVAQDDLADSIANEVLLLARDACTDCEFHRDSLG